MCGEYRERKIRDKLSKIPTFSGLLERGKGGKEGGTEVGGPGSCSGSSGCGELEGRIEWSSEAIARKSKHDNNND